MGKRKQSAPTRATEAKRQTLTWNMLDGETEGAVSVIPDNHPSLQQEAARAAGSQNSKAYSSELEINGTSSCDANLVELFDLHVKDCWTRIQVLKEPSLKEGAWSCKLGEFRVQFSPRPLFLPLPTELPDGVSFSLHMGKDGDKSIFSYNNNGGSSTPSRTKSRRRQAERDVRFWLVDVDLPAGCLEALSCRMGIQVVVDQFCTDNMTMVMRIAGHEGILTKLACPSEAIRPKGVNQALLALMEHFYRVVAPDYEDLPYSRNHDIDELYAVIKRRHTKDQRPILANVQHPDLLPILRLYQQAGITWMVYKEKQTWNNTNGGLHMLYTEITTQDGQTLYYNKQAGVLLRSRPVPVAPSPGGILGDEMGLGKTVEVLALILHHPRDHVPEPEPLPIMPDEPITQKPKKRKSRKKIVITIHEDSDETINYSDIDQPKAVDVSCDIKDQSFENIVGSGDEISQSGAKNCTEYQVSCSTDKSIADEDKKEDKELKKELNDVVKVDGESEVKSEAASSSDIKSDHCYSENKLDADLCDMQGQAESLLDDDSKLVESEVNETVKNEDSTLADVVSEKQGKMKVTKNSRAKSKGKRAVSGVSVPKKKGKRTKADKTEPKKEKKGKKTVVKKTKPKKGAKRTEAEVTQGGSCEDLEIYGLGKRDTTSESVSAMDGDQQLQYRNIFTEMPVSQREEFECVCGSHGSHGYWGRRKKKKHPVQCVECGLWQHAECVNYDLKDALRGEFKCPHCHISSVPVVSGATLIISPFSIANQWVDEILKHVAKESLNVFMYTGVNKQGFIQPRTLARQDIVITTYETLRKELDYVDLPHNNSDAGRKLRYPKRFMALPSPIVAVEWWRICLDEAQMVECTTTKTAEMALRLTAVNRWCVTGTPIQKGIDDLYGLLLFLGVDPYWVQQWWTSLLYKPYCHGVLEPLHDLLTSVLWRTVKKDVLDQIDIPGQTEHLEWLTFSPVEEHFYRRQYKDCVRLSMERLSKWTDSSMRLSSLDRHTVNQLLYPLVRLRQACCHPQAVRGEFIPIQKSTMTMEELLESLTKKARLETEESHRALVAAINGQAGLHIIHEEFVEAVEKYREVLRSVEEHKDRLHTDSLQQLHAMYNLQEILSSKPEGVAPTLRDDLLETQIGELKDKYMAKAIAYVKDTEKALAPVQMDVKELQREFKDGSEWWLEVVQWSVRRQQDDFLFKDGSEWWLEVVQWSVRRQQDDLLVEKVRDDLLDNRNPQIDTLVRSCRSATGLQYAVEVKVSGIHQAYTKLLKAVRALQGPPSQQLINQTTECCLRPVAEILKTCPFCKSEELFEAYEARLFSFVEKGIDQMGDNAGFAVNARRQGTWADSEVEKALKSILSFAKLNKAPEDLINYGTTHIKLLDALKKEYRKLRTHWAGIKEHVGSFDELDMSTSRLRMRLPGEAVPDTPQLNILERSELAQHKLKLSSDRIVAQGELRKKLGQLLYLTNLAKDEAGNKEGDNPEPCPICQTELGKEWSVMQCGHCFCLECIRIMAERASFGRQKFSVKCAVCRQTTYQSEISFVTTKTELTFDSNDVRVVGSHSTKVEAVVRCLLKIQRKDPKAKSLVFSTWTDVLSVIAKALEENDITYRALYAAGKFQQNLSSFKQNADVTNLLLPVHSGANGLNLIEATNVLLVEPILNPAQELQAIGRVHRIGQSKPTDVYRFLVRGTIEQKMQLLVKSLAMTTTGARSGASNVEESGLTIGDLSSLFAQQVEEGENREGVTSMDEMDTPSPDIDTVVNPLGCGAGLDTPCSSTDTAINLPSCDASLDTPIGVSNLASQLGGTAINQLSCDAGLTLGPVASTSRDSDVSKAVENTASSPSTDTVNKAMSCGASLEIPTMSTNTAINEISCDASMDTPCSSIDTAINSLSCDNSLDTPSSATNTAVNPLSCETGVKVPSSSIDTALTSQPGPSTIQDPLTDDEDEKCQLCPSTSKDSGVGMETCAPQNGLN